MNGKDSHWNPSSLDFFSRRQMNWLIWNSFHVVYTIRLTEFYKWLTEWNRIIKFESNLDFCNDIELASRRDCSVKKLGSVIFK